MKSLVNKVKEQLHPQKLNIASVVKEVLKKSDFDSNDERQFQDIIALLQKDIASRVQADIDRIRLSFFRFKFFQDLENQMGADIVTNLYRQLSYEFFKKRQVVFNLGDIGRKFYIILKGTVYVLVKKKGLQDGSLPNEEEEKREEELKQQQIKRATKRHQKKQKTVNLFVTENQVTEDDVLINMPENEYLETKFPFLQKVGTMTSGDSFGEIALTKQMPRTATIVCSEDCHFATVSREQFNKLLSAYYQFIQQMNVNFLQKIPVFSEWNEQMLNQLYYHFVFENKKLFDVIYQEGDDSKFIYIVKEGEIELSQRVEVGGSELNLTLQKFYTKNEKKYERVRASIINSGQIFGHEEILEGTTRIYKAACVSQKVSLFVLDKQRFLTYFQRGGAIDKLKSFDSKRQSARTKSLNALKDLKQIKPMLQNRDIPMLEEKDNLQDFVIQKPKNAVERVGTMHKAEGYQLLQGKGHVNKIHYNFKKNKDSIRKNMKSSEPLLLNNALFDIDGNKGSAISIMNRVFPGATRPKYEIPGYSLPPKLVIRSLRLPKILTDVEALLSNKDHQECVKSFIAMSLTTTNKFQNKKNDQDNKDDSRSLIL